MRTGVPGVGRWVTSRQASSSYSFFSSFAVVVFLEGFYISVFSVAPSVYSIAPLLQQFVCEKGSWRFCDFARVFCVLRPPRPPEFLWHAGGGSARFCVSANTWVISAFWGHPRPPRP